MTLIEKDFENTQRTNARSVGIIFIKKTESIPISCDTILKYYKSIWPIIIEMATRFPNELLTNINCDLISMSSETLKYLDTNNTWQTVDVHSSSDNYIYLCNSLLRLISIVNQNLMNLEDL